MRLQGSATPVDVVSQPLAHETYNDCSRAMRSSHHGFLARLPPDGVTSFKSRWEGAEINIFA